MAIPSKAIIQLGLFFLISRFDLSNPQILMVIRVVYAGVAYLLYSKFRGLEEQINKINDTREIWVPVKKSTGIMDTLFGKKSEDEPQQWTKTTMKEHELALAKAKVDSSLMQLAQPFIMSFLMNLHVLLALNIVLQPLNQWEDPLMQRYVFTDGVQLNDADGKPIPFYGERYTDPESNTSSQITGGESTAPRNVAYEDAILSTWASRDPVVIDQYEEFFQKGVDANYKIVDSGWTILMVVLAGIQNGKKEVEKLLELGARPEVTDDDGSTCLHWAAFHNSPLVSVLGKYYSDEPSKDKAGKSEKIMGSIEDLKNLLLMKDKMNQTALQVAKKEKSAAAEKELELLYKKAQIDID